MNKDMQYKLGVSSVPMRIFGTSEVHHQYKIWNAGKAIKCWKRETLIVNTLA